MMRNCPKNECVIKGFLSRRLRKLQPAQKTIIRLIKLSDPEAQIGMGQKWTSIS